MKAILVLAITLLLFPTVGHNIGTYSLAQWPLLIFMEFLIGVGMGIATNMVFEAVQMAGQVLGVQMGYSLVNILDPQTQVDTTVIALFYQSIVMLLFLRMDVHYWLLRAIGNSFVYMPLGTTHLSSLFTMAVLKMGGEIFGLGSSDRRAGALGHPGRGYCAWPAGQGIAAIAADAAGPGNQEPSGDRNFDRNTEILARPFPRAVLRHAGERRTHPSPGTMRAQWLSRTRPNRQHRDTGSRRGKRAGSRDRAN